jgi:aspartate kinase
MKVLKFGGSSVGTPEAVLQVKQIVDRLDTSAVVVVSALGGVTDRLISLSAQAVDPAADYLTALDELHARHDKMVRTVLPADRQEEILQGVSNCFDELSRILQGVHLIGELTPKTADAIVAYGERISSSIVAALLGARHIDSRRLIRTRPEGAKHIVDFDATHAAIAEADLSRCPLTVMGGFISSDVESGRTTNLGRGGSDYTAAILAAALGAEVLEIWTDVDGFMTADPRVIPTAFTIDELSYDEATELCNFGAKVVYPPTIFPVCVRNIPILVRNTFNPGGRHTVIRRNAAPSSRLIRGISSIGETALVTVSGMSMVGVVGVNRRIFTTLAQAGISVFMVAQSASETSTSLAVTPADAQRACHILDVEFAQEIAAGAMNPAGCRTGLSTVAVVGENLRHHTGTVGRLFSVLGRNGIGVNAVALGALEMSVSFVIERPLLRKALNVLHDSFFMGNHEELNLFICGTGTVGDQLISQLAAQNAILREKRGLNLNLVGVGGRSKSVYDIAGIDPANYRATLNASEEEGGIEHMMRRILELNVFNAVFVDCTASADVAAHYRALLEHHVHVVTANKVAASGPYEDYAALKDIARRRGVKLLFETNVGAGLPIIGTIGDLIASGDRIKSIEAVLSGTLNYVFNTLSAEVPLSEAVRLAQANGYSEPDPRMDLCGMDVVRKITILARESGYRVETSDIAIEPFLPAELFEGSTEAFMEALPQLDAAFERERQRLVAEGKCWRYVAEWKDGKGSVGLREIPIGHPLYQLEGSNNIICLTTARYDTPMIIRGYGAGAAVTAAGVFADVMRVANI